MGQEFKTPPCKTGAVGIYAVNAAPVEPPEIETAYPRRQPLPEDFADRAVVAMLRNAGFGGDELVRLEDHIRHHPRTLLGVCGKDEAAERLRAFREVPEKLRIEVGKLEKEPNPDLLPPLRGGQWRLCVGCPHFALNGRTGRCSKRWVCKWGASPPYREWNVDRDNVPYHPQCARIARHFRFEAALLEYTGNAEFEPEIRAFGDAERLAAERRRLLRRDLAAAAEAGDLARIRKRCAELGESFAEFAARYDVPGRMLNYWRIDRKLLDNVRLLQKEGIPIPETCRDALLNLDGPPAEREELRRLL